MAIFNPHLSTHYFFIILQYYHMLLSLRLPNINIFAIIRCANFFLSSSLSSSSLSSLFEASLSLQSNNFFESRSSWAIWFLQSSSLNRLFCHWGHCPLRHIDCLIIDIITEIIQQLLHHPRHRHHHQQKKRLTLLSQTASPSLSTSSPSSSLHTSWSSSPSTLSSSSTSSLLT